MGKATSCECRCDTPPEPWLPEVKACFASLEAAFQAMKEPPVNLEDFEDVTLGTPPQSPTFLKVAL